MNTYQVTVIRKGYGPHIWTGKFRNAGAAIKHVLGSNSDAICVHCILLD